MINRQWEWIILLVRSLTVFEENMFVTVLAKLVPLFFKSEHALFFLCSQNCLFWKWHRYFQNLLITPLLLLKFPYPKISAFVKKKNLVISFMLHLWRVDSRVLNWIVPKWYFDIKTRNGRHNPNPGTSWTHAACPKNHLFRKNTWIWWHHCQPWTNSTRWGGGRSVVRGISVTI